MRGVTGSESVWSDSLGDALRATVEDPLREEI